MESKDNQLRIKLKQASEKKDKVIIENGFDFEWKMVPTTSNPYPVEEVALADCENQKEKRTLLPPIIILTRIVLPIAIALIIGIGLGVSALKLASYQSKQQNTSALENQPSTDVIATGAIHYTKNLDNYVIQGGVFSTEQAVKTEQEKVATQNIPNVIIQQGEQYLLLLGLSGTLEGAKKEAEAFQQKNIAAYAKQMAVKEESQQTFSTSQKETIAIIERNFVELRAGLMLLRNEQPITEMHVMELPTSDKDETLTKLLQLNEKNIAAFDNLQTDNSFEKLNAFEQNLLEFFQFYLDF